MVRLETLREVEDLVRFKFYDMDENAESFDDIPDLSTKSPREPLFIVFRYQLQQLISKEYPYNKTVRR